MTASFADFKTIDAIINRPVVDQADAYYIKVKESIEQNDVALDELYSLKNRWDETTLALDDIANTKEYLYKRKIQLKQVQQCMLDISDVEVCEEIISTLIKDPAIDPQQVDP